MGVCDRFAAVPDSVPAARRAVERFASQVGVDDETLGAVRLAVTEACTNAVLHAYVGAEEPGTFTVTAEIVSNDEGPTLRVVVRDEGRGMVPRLDSPGIGFGLPLIAQVAETFEVRAPRGQRGTEVCMRFPLRAVGVQ